MCNFWKSLGLGLPLLGALECNFCLRACPHGGEEVGPRATCRRAGLGVGRFPFSEALRRHLTGVGRWWGKLPEGRRGGHAETARD